MELLNFEWIGGRKRPADTAPLLVIERVSVRRGQRMVFADISLEMYQGERLRITGSNGAGKSTLLNAIAGVLPLAGGRILFQGRDISRLPVHERARRGIRYIRQDKNVFTSLTVRQNLQLALGGDGYERFAQRFPNWALDIGADRSAGLLSGGQRQKLAWGMGVLHPAKLLLIDEASTGSADAFELPVGSSVCYVDHVEEGIIP